MRVLWMDGRDLVRLGHARVTRRLLYVHEYNSGTCSARPVRW